MVFAMLAYRPVVTNIKGDATAGWLLLRTSDTGTLSSYKELPPTPVCALSTIAL